MKQNQRALYQSAVRLFAHCPANSTFTEPRDGKTYQVQLGDTPGLPFSDGYPQPIRVVRSDTHPESLPPAPTPTGDHFLRRLGHDRWKNENNGWMDLTKHWAFKHGFLHACRHRPQRRSPQGTRQPVPNRGLAAVTLILLLAFTLCSAFTLRHSKLFRRYHLTAIEVAHQLHPSLSKLPPRIRAPDS